MWKAGCLTAIVGVLLTIGSVVLFGTAIKQAVTSREVTSVQVESGQLFESRDIRVDPGGQIQIQIDARIELSENTLARSSQTNRIENLSSSVSYEVRDETGDLVYNESGAVGGSAVVPSASSSHRDAFDPAILCTFRGTRFDAPDFGVVRVLVEIPEVDDSGNQIRSGQLTVFDKIPRNSSNWAWGGVLSMLGGPFVTFIGFIVFVVGLFKRMKKQNTEV